MHTIGTANLITAVFSTESGVAMALVVVANSVTMAIARAGATCAIVATVTADAGADAIVTVSVATTIVRAHFSAAVNTYESEIALTVQVRLSQASTMPAAVVNAASYRTIDSTVPRGTMANTWAVRQRLRTTPMSTTVIRTVDVQHTLTTFAKVAGITSAHTRGKIACAMV